MRNQSDKEKFSGGPVDRFSIVHLGVGIRYVYVDHGTHLYFPDAERPDLCVIRPRPAEPWNGEGLPPAGLEVEWKQGSNHEWVRATVIAYFKEEAWISVKGGYPIEVGNPAHFRPIRTPEQIAADEQAKAVHQMGLDAGFSGSVQEFAERLYQAGYRKQVAP